MNTSHPGGDLPPMVIMVTESTQGEAESPAMLYLGGQLSVQQDLRHLQCTRGLGSDVT